MKLQFERKLPVILFFVFLILTLIGIVFFQNTRSLQDAINWEKETQETLLKLDETLTLTLDIETAVRGFVIVGNNTYLDPYEQAKPKIRQNVERIKALTSDNELERAEVDQLSALTADLITDSERKIAMRKSGRF